MFFQVFGENFLNAEKIKDDDIAAETRFEAFDDKFVDVS